MPTITTHPGGAYYKWRSETMGAPPPASFSEDSREGILYHAWQHGVPRAAARAEYEAAGQPPIGPPPGSSQGSSAPIGPPPAQGSIGPPPAQQGGAGGPTATVATIPVSGGGGGVTTAPAPVVPPGNPFGFNADQLANAYTVLSVGFAKKASDLALRAMCCLCDGENNWSSFGCNSSNHCGLFQLDSSWQGQHDYHDVAYWAAYAYDQGFYGKGGIIALARDNPKESPGWVTNQCQGAYADPQAGADYYNGHLAHADAILNYYAPYIYKGWKPVSTGTGTPGGQPVPVTAGPLEAQLRELNWAGYDINLWKAVSGGANEASHMAQTYLAQIQKIQVVKPHQAWERKL